MNEFEPEQLETELQHLRLARPPTDFMARCADALESEVFHQKTTQSVHRFTFVRWLRWLAPLTAAAALAALFFIRSSSDSSTKSQNSVIPGQTGQAMKADNVEIVEQLVATFDAVAHLPDGAPVRFRCSEWFDDVVLRDSSRGILIQHRVPRLEVEPVSFETY